MYCGGYDSCALSSINAARLKCAGYQSCRASNISTWYIACVGPYACYNIDTLYFRPHVEHNAYIQIQKDASQINCQNFI